MDQPKTVSGRRFILGCSAIILVMTCTPLIWFAWANDYIDFRFSHRFDSATWKQSTSFGIHDARNGMYEDLVAHYLHPGMDIAEVHSLLGKPEIDLKGGDLREALVNRDLEADRLLGYTVTERVHERQEVRIALDKGKVIQAWIEWFSS